MILSICCLLVELLGEPAETERLAIVKLIRKAHFLHREKHDRRFVVSRVLKPEEDRDQLSLFEGDEYAFFIFATNTMLESEEVVISYEKRGNSENYIKEAKYDMGAGHLLLKSLCDHEVIAQLSASSGV